MAPWGKYHVDVPPAPCVYLRRTFRLKAEPVRARLYATALGIYQARINGQPVSERELAPGWTDYTQRVRYQTYDVTPMLHAGDNAWGTVLADGWYAGYLAWSGRLHFGDYPLAFLGRLVVQYADGSEEVVTTDSQWTAATGPLRSADLLMGTVYDARRDMPGWDQPDFAADGWQPVEVLVDRRVSLIADWSPAIRVTQTLAPVRVTKEAIGRFLVDFGQNFSGRVRLTLPAGSHERVIIRYGEVLQPDGSLYTANLRTARATDVYWPAQTGVQVIEPIHTVHGFRYVEVQGVETLTAESVEGLVVHSDAVKAGRFQSDNALVNQLVSNIDWGLRSNIVGVPTDCPQRDERLGLDRRYSGVCADGAVVSPNGRLLTSWLEELAAAQFPDGAYPDVAPRVRGIQGGVAAWGDAGVLVPWALYQYYGDVRILAQHYPAMQRWVAYLTEHSRNGLRAAEGYGDWLFVEAETPKDVVATAYYAHVVQIVAKVARVLGYWRDAARYQQQFGQIADAFCRAFVAPDGRIQGDTQTGYVLALAFGLAPSPIAGAFLQRLVGLIHARQDHIDTGFLGVGHILHVLSARGYHQLACRLVTQEDYPSWGYMIRQGATTIWERWNGMLPDGSGFANVRMNSFNHYALGAVGDWLYRYVAGIRPQQPGFAAVEIEPGLDLDAFRAVQAAYPSPFGEVTVRWTHTPQGLSGEVTVPAGVVATVRWPAQAPGALDARDSLGNPLFPTAWRNDRAEYQVGSGRYAFAARMVPGE
jgi:alpha-L-rhamnosidase